MPKAGKFNKHVSMSKKSLAALVTIITTALLLFLLFHDIIKDPNNVSFASAGDGIKSTYGTLYHIKYDTAYWYTEMMNYPYGESVFFTGNQVFLTNFLKLLKESGLDLGNYALGISNLLILFSFVLCALFLFLIFNELGISALFSVLFAIILTFLTPQWDRLTGHYNLAYAYAFPVAIYLIMIFYRKPGYVLSGIIGLYLFFLCSKHLYFYVLIGVMLGLLWLYILFFEKHRFGGLVKAGLHMSIQLFLPLIIFTLFSSMYDVNLDRTAYPWGFIQSTTRLVSVFLPLQHPYFPFIHTTSAWKTVAYVGAVASLTFLFILIKMPYKTIRDKSVASLFRVSDNRALNILFWASVVSFLLSLGLPFSLGLEKWLNYTGPFRQFRAIGRFVFPFFYMLNILAFYLLWKLLTTRKLWWTRLILILALFMTGYDAYQNIASYPKNLNNRIKTLNDRQNVLPEDQWVNEFDLNLFQAIMPFPYFHVGSENYWVSVPSKVETAAFIASLKTGLPLNAVALSRTSISQTLKNLDLYFEPYRGYPILDDLPSMKPFLFFVMKGEVITNSEKRLISHAHFLSENDSHSFYSFYPDSLRVLVGERQRELQGLVAESIDAAGDSSVIHEAFENYPEGIYSHDITTKTWFYETILPDTGSYIVSFWTYDGDVDLYPRTRLVVTLSIPGKSNYFYYDMDIQRRVVARDGSKILFEDRFPVRYPESVIRFRYQNKVLTKGQFRIDDLLIRKAEVNTMFVKDGHIWVNDREIFEDQ